MLLNDHLKLAGIAVPNIPANGPIGIALTTVDIASWFQVAQTTANITATLPNPTDALGAHVAVVGLTPGSTQPLAMYGCLILPGRLAVFAWNGSAWLPMTGALPRITPNPTIGVLATSGQITATTTNTATITHTTEREVHVNFRWQGNANAGAWSTWTLPALAGYTLNRVSVGWYSPTGFDAAAGAARMDQTGSPWTTNTVYANLRRAIAGFYLNVWASYSLN